MKEHFHMIGINGIGLSGVARIMLDLGYKITGSDPKSSELTDKLTELGAVIYNFHKAENIEGADYLVISSAIPFDNPEVEAAREKGIPILHRAQLLGYIMKDLTGIAVSGTHGKTTTSSMIASLLEYNNLNPTVVIGGELNGIGSNAKLGKSEYMVIEADESDASFLHLDPRWTIVTNIDVDVNLNVAPYSHLNFDYEKTLQKVKDAFMAFINRIPDNGKLILCIDDSNVRKMISDIEKPYITYGLSEDADIRATDVNYKNFGSISKVYKNGEYLGEMVLNVPGKHNVLNGLATVAQGFELGLEFEQITNSLLAYRGVKRRFERIGEVNNILIVDDYAHNPAKVRALLQGAKTGDRDRVVAVFQPHRYTRTKFLFEEFTESFSDCDVLVLAEIYGAGEVPIVGVRGEVLAKSIEASPKRPKEIHFIPGNDEIVDFLEYFARPGDLIITCGAGDIHKVGKELVTRLPDRWLEKLAAG